MSRFHVSPYEDRAEINLSPMLDVVFILLIFFIVVASFIREEGLPVSLPDGISVPPADFVVVGDGSKARDTAVAVDAGRSIGHDVVMLQRQSP